MSPRWLAVSFVLFAGGWGIGLLGLPLFGALDTTLLVVWALGAFAGAFLTCRCHPAIRAREATAGAVLMAAAVSGIHAIFPGIELFAPPAALGSWAAVAAVVFAASLLGTLCGSRLRGGAGRIEGALVGALVLVGAFVVISLLYALAGFVFPSFAVAFVFMFALLGAPAVAGVIAVLALGERGRDAIIGGATSLGLLSWVLGLTAELSRSETELGPIIVSLMAFALIALLVGLIGLAGVELAERKGWGPAGPAGLPRAAVR